MIIFATSLRTGKINAGVLGLPPQWMGEGLRNTNNTSFHLPDFYVCMDSDYNRIASFLEPLPHAQCVFVRVVNNGNDNGFNMSFATAL